ncbi:E3 ubiquitin-protein ligase TRAIP [Neodiprion virginianus]|uniref:E3 ubiquitin-protein ligase TRAIP n=1 Tax=Neodiprion virginianus TaxID=2961670 RepID=UPI001EE6D4ED|nr:E3 ubiquitin-protein ligase TRAIP [Neodiprion virginianus]
MNITCCICAELLVPSDDVTFTPCGHFFHFVCVTHWLERSKTCPQCRTKVTEKTIHRAYFNFSNTDTNREDVGQLHSKIDSLKFEIKLKDLDIKNCGEENAKFKAQNTGLRAEVKKLEVEIEKHRSAIYALKEQAKYLKEKSSDADAAQKEVVRLKACLQQCHQIQTLITGSQVEVDKMLSESHDRESLVTYLSIMKREMSCSLQRRKEIRERVRKLQEELLVVKSERNDLMRKETKFRQLEANLSHCENEKKSLELKLDEIKKQLASNTTLRTSEDIQRYIAESPAPESMKASKKRATVPASIESDVETDDSPSVIQSPTPRKLKILRKSVVIPDTPELNLKDDSSNAVQNPTSRRMKILRKPLVITDTPESDVTPSVCGKKSDDEASSPYLPVKSQGVGVYSILRQSSRVRPSSSSLSILAKKPRLDLSQKGAKSKELQYDGFGGHSKVDDFPSPILKCKKKKNNLMSVRVKRSKTSNDNNKKLDKFFIDLT